MNGAGLVLVIGEELGTRDVLSRALAEADFGIRTACDVSEGLAAAQTCDFDVILLEMNLPRQNGLEALGAVRQRRPDLPVIVVAARGDAAMGIEALRLGAYHYITRPFDPDEVCLTAERAVAQRKIIDENRLLRLELKQRCGLDNTTGNDPEPPRVEDIPVTAALREVERFHIERVLRDRNWNQSAAAKVLGVDRKTLRSKIREFRLVRPVDASAGQRPSDRVAAEEPP